MHSSVRQLALTQTVVQRKARTSAGGAQQGLPDCSFFSDLAFFLYFGFGGALTLWVLCFSGLDLVFVVVDGGSEIL